MLKKLLLVLVLCSALFATVSSETVREFKTCNGSTTEFSSNIPSNAASEISVYKVLLSTGEPTELEQDVDYTITYNGDSYLEGCTITITPAVAATYKIAIERNIEKTQETVSAAINQISTEAALDKLTRITQDLQDRQDRSIRLKAGDTDADLEIPADRANKIPIFDVNGNLSVVTTAEIGTVVDGNITVENGTVNITGGATTITGGTITQDVNYLSMSGGNAFVSGGNAFVSGGNAFVSGGTTTITGGTTTVMDVNYINIKDYGAVGDGVTDDTTAIETALASGKSLFVPAGTYKLTAAITIPSHCFMYGEEKPNVSNDANTVFLIDHDGDGFVIDNTAADRIYLSGFVLTKEGTDYEGTGKGIKIYTSGTTNGTGRDIQNIKVDYFDTGIYLAACTMDNFEKIIVRHCTSYGIEFYGATSHTGPHDCYFKDVWIYTADVGIYFSGYNLMHTFEHIKIMSCITRAIEGNSNAGGRIAFRDVMFGDSTAAGASDLIKLVYGSNWVFDGVYVAETIPLFSEDTANAGITVRSGSLSTGGIGTNNILVENVCQSSRAGTIKSNLKDTIINHRYEDVYLQSPFINSDTIYGEEIISPSYQAGIGKTQYLNATRQDFTSMAWINSSITVATGQTDPYGGTGAYKITGTGFIYTAAAYGADPNGKTFIFQVWAKGVDTKSDVILKTAHTATNIKTRQYYLDRNDWTLCSVAITANEVTPTSFTVYVFNAASDVNGVYLYEPCFYQSDTPCAFQNANDTYIANKPFVREFGKQKNYQGEVLLSATTVSLAADADTTLYTVPAGYRCVLTKAVLVAGADAGTTTISIGQNTAETDFVTTSTLSNIDAQYDTAILMPIPSETPLKTKSYAAATVIQAKVASHAGGATNTLYLYGMLY